MSTATYPLGMESYNNRQLLGGYKSWKGAGVFSNPVAITSGNIRPLTNNDLTNVIPGKQGLPRPIKHYRKGTTVPVPIIVEDPENPGSYIEISNNRQVKSSVSQSLVGQTIDRPGAYSIKENTTTEITERTQLDKDCVNCQGIGLTTNYYPQTNLTNNPLPVTEQITNCCNEQRKALRRVRPASTNIKRNYYTTHKQYMQNRCQTYDQKVFNFYSGATNGDINLYAKPGTPLAQSNLYVGNCYPNTGLSGYTEAEIINKAFAIMVENGALSPTDIANYYNNSEGINTFAAFASYLSTTSNPTTTRAIFKSLLDDPYLGMSLTGPSNPRGCKLVVYKPNNPQFAQQGGVTSSTRTLKLGVTTIETFVGQNNKLKRGTDINFGSQPQVPFIYKTKVPPCQPALPIIFRQVEYNPKTCSFIGSTDQLNKEYQNLGNLSAGPTVANNGISTSW